MMNTSQKRPSIALLLCGCGHQDGSEIHESVITMLFLEKLGCRLSFFAPDMPQATVKNHLKKTLSTGEHRNMMIESARIARGDIKPLKDCDVKSFDALVIPGGFGVALNLCNFAERGQDMTVLSEVGETIEAFFEQKKVIGAICIAPVLVAKVLGSRGVKVTIGNDPDTAQAIISWGAKHIDCDVNDCVVDEKSRVVTTPAYMLGRSMVEVAAGIEKACSEIFRLSSKA